MKYRPSMMYTSSVGKEARSAAAICRLYGVTSEPVALKGPSMTQGAVAGLAHVTGASQVHVLSAFTVVVQVPAAPGFESAALTVAPTGFPTAPLVVARPDKVTEWKAAALAVDASEVVAATTENPCAVLSGAMSPVLSAALTVAR